MTAQCVKRCATACPSKSFPAHQSCQRIPKKKSVPGMSHTTHTRGSSGYTLTVVLVSPQPPSWNQKGRFLQALYVSKNNGLLQNPDGQQELSKTSHDQQILEVCQTKHPHMKHKRFKRQNIRNIRTPPCLPQTNWHFLQQLIAPNPQKISSHPISPLPTSLSLHRYRRCSAKTTLERMDLLELKEILLIDGGAFLHHQGLTKPI